LTAAAALGGFPPQGKERDSAVKNEEKQLRSAIPGQWGGNWEALNEFAYLPAAGVMTTRPVIMPCTAPITDGLLKKRTSNKVQTKRLMAAQMLVLMTAMEESMLAA